MQQPFQVCGFVLGLICWSALNAAAISNAELDFERYRQIIERQPFGEVAATENALAADLSAASLSQDLEMRAIIDDGHNQLRVGFLDKQSNKTFYLGVGETNEGYSLISVNYDEEEAVLQKGMLTAVFTLRPHKALEGAAPGAPMTAMLTPTQPPPLPSAAPAAERPAGPPKPLFSDLKRKRFSPFRPLGTNAPIPFQSQAMEGLMQASTNIPPGLTGGIQAFQPLQPAGPEAVSSGWLTSTGTDGPTFPPFQPLAAEESPSGSEGVMEGFWSLDPAQEGLPAMVPLFELEGEAMEELVE
ncbi:MAG: hypothetical protein GX806_01760 [Lentisphaerae bacterium]|nr:hypothetical protein [Lentisphaerota bacterium]